MKRFSIPSYSLKAFFVFILLVHFSVPFEAQAIGGSDESAASQINAATETCQDTIRSAISTYVTARKTLISACLQAYMACDQQATDSAAETCRNNLLEVDTGLCAEGKLDSGADSIGPDTAFDILTAASTADIDQALITLIGDVKSDCIDPAGVIFDIANQGLNFSDDIIDEYDIVDLLNRVEGGVGCQANALVKSVYPLVTVIVTDLQNRHLTCIDVDAPNTVGDACAVDNDCGVTNGKCGKLAKAVQPVGGSFYNCSVELPCGAGNQIDPFGFECVPCIPGRFSASSDSSVCESCAAGKYQNAFGQTSCIDCPAGTAVDSASANNCPKCLAGTYSDPGMTACVSCDAGEYAPQSGAEACISCPRGTFSGIGASGCTSCDPGKFTDTTGAEECDTCPAGRYQPSTGQSTCLSCPAGSFSADTGAASCTECDPGKFASDAASLNCLDCEPGTYAPNSGSAECLDCPAGTHATESGATACESCSAGTFSDSAGSAECSACAAGTYTPASNMTACLSCPAGTFAESTGATECTACEKGTFASEAEATSCERCPAGRIAARSGMTQCRRCPREKRANRKRTRCIARRSR